MLAEEFIAKGLPCMHHSHATLKTDPLYRVGKDAILGTY
jgi:hypothetical protein